MKFYFKALVAAVALSASTMASAAYTNSGNGSLFLTLIDKTKNTEISFDTGLFYNDFNEIGAATDTNWGSLSNALAGKLFDLSGNANFISFIRRADKANTYFGIFAGDVKGDVDAIQGDHGFISSYDKNYTDFDLISVDRSELTTVGDSMDYGLQNGDMRGAYVDDKLAGSQIIAMAKLGETMGLVQYVSNTSYDTSKFVYPTAEVKFNARGVLTITPNVMTAVPEADTYAMFMAGLGLMGVVARRRKSI